MFRRLLIGLLAVAGLAATGWMQFQHRAVGRLGQPDAVQWPFDPDELRDLMNRVIADQRERVARIEDASGRARAEAFLDYYEQRRQAAAS